MNHKRIVLVGMAGSGKDYLKRKFADRGYVSSVSYTTRPPRIGEKNNEDYRFVSKEDFENLIANDLFYEFVKFNDWAYGTTKDQFFTDDVFIMTPAGISKIKPEDREDCFIIYLDIPWEVRKRRLEERAMPGDTVERRMIADDLDFKDFKDYDIRITNADF